MRSLVIKQICEFVGFLFLMYKKILRLDLQDSHEIFVMKFIVNKRSSTKTLVLSVHLPLLPPFI